VRIFVGVTRARAIAAAFVLAAAGGGAAGEKGSTLRVSVTVARSVEVAVTGSGASAAVAIRRPDGSRVSVELGQVYRLAGVSVGPAGAPSPPGWVVVTVLPDAPLAP
jgi:hypothetical protein